jgi:prepilin-type N-terminal cleavage/methylation domain-containing protein
MKIKRELGNKGFSLLELLVGITMLAIIVVPIMHAFITSSSTTSRAQEVRNQTVAAQNVLESYEATDISTIISGIKKDVAPFGTITSEAAQVFVHTAANGYQEVTDSSTEVADGPQYKINLPGITAGNKKYDAVLHIDATQYSALNAEGIVDYKSMDAVYIQPNDDSSPDVLAAKEFASKATIESGYDVDYNQFLNSGIHPMRRTVTITINKIGDQTGVITCKADFKYIMTAYRAIIPSYVLTDGTVIPSSTQDFNANYETTISSDFYSGNYSASENGIYGLYFFFNPILTPSVSALEPGDDIEVINRGNIDMSVYLIRQTAASGSYNPDINLREKYDETRIPPTPHTQIYYNKDQNEYKTYTFRVGFLQSSGSYVDWIRDSILFDGNLVGTPAKNRLYKVTVDIYKLGTGFSGTPLATFDASSLE